MCVRMSVCVSERVCVSVWMQTQKCTLIRIDTLVHVDVTHTYTCACICTDTCHHMYDSKYDHMRIYVPSSTPIAEWFHHSAGRCTGGLWRRRPIEGRRRGGRGTGGEERREVEGERQWKKGKEIRDRGIRWRKRGGRNMGVCLPV